MKIKCINNYLKYKINIHPLLNLFYFIYDINNNINVNDKINIFPTYYNNEIKIIANKDKCNADYNDLKLNLFDLTIKSNLKPKNNKIIKHSNNPSNDDNNKASNETSNKTSNEISNETTNEASNDDCNNIFSFPINENNFLNIILKINNLNDLINYLYNIDNYDEEHISLIMDLFWLNNNDIINDIDHFISLNIYIISKIFDINVDTSIMQKIINKIIKKYTYKKINYISLIKKYITKYI